MSGLAYLRGGASMVVAVVTLALAGREVRRWLAPGRTGAIARLTDVVIGLGILVVTLEVLGAAGWFSTAPVLLGVPLAGLVVAALARRRARPAATPLAASAADTGGRGALAFACLLAAIVLGQWVAHTARVVGHGYLDMDTLRYHGPFAARWVEQHSLMHLQHTSSETQESFFPATSELLDAYGILLFGRDILTPLLNVGWLLLGFGAAWCVGETRRGRAAAVAALAAVCSTPLLSSIEPGSAKNDLAAAVLLLTAVTLLLRAPAATGRRGSWFIAGLAAGIAVGTKLTVVVPIIVLVAAAIWWDRRRRDRTALALVGAIALTGSFWYVRNLVAIGNPLPWLGRLGPLDLPVPAMRVAHRDGFSILHYRFDRSFWTGWVPRGLVGSFGPLWFVLLGGALVLAASSLLSSSTSPTKRVLGAAVLTGMVAYLLMPYSAGGPPGHPDLFALDLRFLTPVLVVAGVGVVRRRHERAVLVAAGALVLVDQWSGKGRWSPSFGGALVATGFVLAVIAIAVLTARLLDPARTAIAGGVLTVAVIAAGWPLANADLHGRYAAGSTDVTAAFARFRDTQDLRIGVGGFADLYPLYGLALDNEVQYVGFTEPAGGFHAPLTCAAWRTALGAGRYEYVVISRSPVASQTIPRETRWTAGDPAAHLVLRRGVTSVFRLTGRPDPAGCAGHPIPSSGPRAPPSTGT